MEWPGSFSLSYASAAGTCQKRHPMGLMETDGPKVHRHTQK
jgi:hypothetical protein